MGIANFAIILLCIAGILFSARKKIWRRIIHKSPFYFAKEKVPPWSGTFVSGIRVSGMGISPCRLRRPS